MFQPCATAMSSWWCPQEVATVGLGVTHERRFLQHTRHAEVGTDDASRAFSNLHKSSKPSARANGIMLEWDVRQRLLGKTPDNEMQLNPSMKRRSSRCAVSRVCWVARHLSDLTYSPLIENFMRKTTYASIGLELEHCALCGICAQAASCMDVPC